MQPLLSAVKGTVLRLLSEEVEVLLLWWTWPWLIVECWCTRVSVKNKTFAYYYYFKKLKYFWLHTKWLNVEKEDSCIFVFNSVCAERCFATKRAAGWANVRGRSHTHSRALSFKVHFLHPRQYKRYVIRSISCCFRKLLKSSCLVTFLCLWLNIAWNLDFTTNYFAMIFLSRKATTPDPTSMKMYCWSTQALHKR